MKTFILIAGLTLGALQADTIVMYDINTNNTESIKPNHPNQDLY